MSTSLRLSNVKILKTGSAGGHLYIRGRCELSGHGDCDVYAYFRSKDDERTFESQFSGQSVVVEANTVDFLQGIGGSIPEIKNWNLT